MSGKWLELLKQICQALRTLLCSGKPSSPGAVGQLAAIQAMRPQSGDERLVSNLFDNLPARADGEIFTEVLSREDVRIERIVSTGQSTPADKPHRQGHDEWVLLLAGSAGLRIEGEGERNLRPGDHVLIGVTWTAKDEPTIWLAIHFR
jgi:cupin 2 domain-containing protein